MAIILFLHCGYLNLDVLNTSFNAGILGLYMLKYFYFLHILSKSINWTLIVLDIEHQKELRLKYLCEGHEAVKERVRKRESYSVTTPKCHSQCQNIRSISCEHQDII